jgi:hypothetical protein
MGRTTNSLISNKVPQCYPLNELNPKKNIGYIRRPSGVLKIATFHMQAKTPMHQLNLTMQTLNEFCFVQEKD